MTLIYSSTYMDLVIFIRPNLTKFYISCLPISSYTDVPNVPKNGIHVFVFFFCKKTAEHISDFVIKYILTKIVFMKKI